MPDVFDKNKQPLFGDNKNPIPFFLKNYPFLLKDKIDNEEIIFLLRRHPVTQLGWIINTIIALFILFSISLFLQKNLNIFTIEQIVFLDIMILALIFSYVFLHIINWLFNIGIVTNKRVIDIDFNGFLCREVSTAFLNKIEETTARNTNFFSSIFNYGTVFIQTAGTEQNVEFTNIANPNEVAESISNLTRRSKKK